MNRRQLAPFYRGRTACPDIFSGSSTKLINKAKLIIITWCVGKKTTLPAKSGYERLACGVLRDVLFCGLGFFG